MKSGESLTKVKSTRNQNVSPRCTRTDRIDNRSKKHLSDSYSIILLTQWLNTSQCGLKHMYFFLLLGYFCVFCLIALFYCSGLPRHRQKHKQTYDKEECGCCGKLPLQINIFSYNYFLNPFSLIQCSDQTELEQFQNSHKLYSHPTTTHLH